MLKHDADGFAQTTWEATEFVDSLGLHMVLCSRARADVIVRQQRELLELSTPVVKLWDGILALPMIRTLDSARTQIVMESLLQKIVETGSELAVIDIISVPTVDTLAAQRLLKTVTAIRLMGAECIISGVRPQIAQTIVHLGIDLAGVQTQAMLTDALRSALKMIGVDISRATPGTAARWMDRIPILRLGEVLSISVQVDLQDRLTMALQENLAEAISQTGAKGVLIDISALEIVDSFIGRMVAAISSVSRPMDARTVLVAMQSPSRWWNWACRCPASPPHSISIEACACLRASGPEAVHTLREETLPMLSELDIVLSRQAVRRACVEANFSLVDQTKMITAASALARNTVVYGSGGTMHPALLEDGLLRGARLKFPTISRASRTWKVRTPTAGFLAPAWAWGSPTHAGR